MQDLSTATSLGRVLAIDPSSCGTSPIGYAIFWLGHVQAVGTIDIERASKYESIPAHLRLKAIAPAIAELGNFNVLAIEQLRGSMVPSALWWAAGVIIQSAQYEHLIEVPISSWKTLTPQGYIKSDEMDAYYIGQWAIENSR